MAKKVQLMTNTKEWQTVNGVEVLIDIPQEDLDPITDSNCVGIEGHRTLEETISQENMFTPEIVETKVHSKVGGVYHDNVVDGAYEEAILYGNTQVNLVESMTSDTKYIPHSFTSFQGNERKIGNYYSGRTNQVAPLVKGVTMVNLAQTTNSSVKVSSGVWVNNIKPSTKYTLNLTYTIQNSQKGLIIQSYNNTTYLENSKQITGLETNVQLTFITHGNANAIRICNAEGYGGETIQLDNIMVIEGDVTDLNLPFFKGMRSVELSRPLTNLFTNDLVHYNHGTSSTNTNGDITVTSTGVSSWNNTDYYLKNLKPHTKYIVMWDSLTTTQTATTQQEILVCVVSIQDNVKLGGINEDEKCPTLRSIIFDTRDKDLSQISFRIHASMSNSEATSTTVTGLRVFEWDDSLRTLDLQTIGYFSGTKYVSAPRTLETEGKNLYPYGDINFTPTSTGWFDAKGTNYMYGDIAQKSKCRFLLKKGTYKLSSDYNNRTNLGYMVLVTDKEETMKDTTFTLEEDTYLTLRLQPVEANVPTTLTNIQIERGETVTTYEAYQSRYYKPRETEEIILRSLPNGVCDTFNLQTGELVQRIGETVLDGSSENWVVGSYTEIPFHIQGELPNNCTAEINSTKILSSYNKQIFENSSYGSVSATLYYRRRGIVFCPPEGITTREQAIEYIQANPVTVQYELAEPIITKLQTYNRVYSGQTNAPTSMGNNLSALTYYSNNYYLKVGNLSPVPAILEPITSISYDVRLKPSTLYTVKYNRGGYSNSMKFDLGGSVVEKTNVVTSTTGIAEELTVRTPAILSHEQLILSGTGYAHNFIIVEGDITGTELPYFEGMKDVKMPIVKNIGKNLFHGVFELGTMSSTTGEYTDVITAIRATDYTKVIGGKQYVFYCDDLYYKFAYVQYDKNKKFLRTSGGYVSGAVITLQPDVEYVIMRTPDGQSPLMNNPHVKLTLYEYEEGMDTTLQNYKENSIYAVQGEYPITSEMVEQGGFSTGNGKYTIYETMKYEASIRLRSKDLIPVKPNTTYHIDATNMGRQLVYNIYTWNGNREFMEGYSYTNNDYKIPFTFTTTADTQYIHMLYSKYGNGDITVAEYDWSQFHIYELDSTISLRSLPNGVKDELNLLTGEYIQRVGEVVLDNTETWNMDTTENAVQSNTNIFYTGVHSDFKPLATVDRAGSLVCDKVNVVPDLYFVDKVGIMVNTDPRVYVRVLKTDAPDVATFTTYIKNNPLTLQYELAEPIISHVRLVSSNQEREVGVKLPNGVCNTYNPSTGITTVRVGKIVLDGSEDEGWKTAADNTGGAFRFETLMLSGKFNGVTNDYEVPVLLCDKYNTYKFFDIYKGNVVGITFYMSSHIVIYDNKYADLASFKQALQSNPITVWYELNYPQIQPDIVLPNGVHDEYNPETGVYTKRVGFIEFDGSEAWTAGHDNGELQQAVNGAVNMYGVWTAQPLPNVKPAIDEEHKVAGVCDTFPFKNARLDETNEEFYFISTSGRFNMNIARKKLTGSNVSHLKAYLPQNPIKLWYELQTPITYQLTPYFGLPQPYAYEDGYLIHESAYAETTLPPEFKYKLVANRTGQVMQNNRKLQEHTTRLSNLEALIIEATIQSLFDRELQLFELELMDIQLVDLGE